MKPREETSRECLFTQRYKEEGEELFIALYRYERRLFLVTSKEKGGDIEVELSREDALDLLAALQRGLKKEPNQPPEPIPLKRDGSS